MLQYFYMIYSAFMALRATLKIWIIKEIASFANCETIATMTWEVINLLKVMFHNQNNE